MSEEAELMDIYLSPEQLDLRSDVRAFLDDHYPPERILQMEQDEEYPDDFYCECAKRGWTGIPVPKQYGGSDGSVLDLCVFVEEVGKTSISLSTLSPPVRASTSPPLLPPLPQARSWP